MQRPLAAQSGSTFTTANGSLVGLLDFLIGIKGLVTSVEMPQ